MSEKIIHRNQEIAFEIPENHYELKLLKMRLETEYSLLKEALKLEQTNKERQRLREQEISPLKSKIKAVNMALSSFKGEPKQRNRPSKKGISQKYQRMLLALKEEEFPRNQSDKEKFNWAVSQWQKAMDLLFDESLTETKKEELIVTVKKQFSVVSTYLKEELSEAELEAKRAKEILKI